MFANLVGSIRDVALLTNRLRDVALLKNRLRDVALLTNRLRGVTLLTDRLGDAFPAGEPRRLLCSPTSSFTQFLSSEHRVFRFSVALRPQKP